MARTKDAVLAPEQKELMEKEYLDFVKPSTYGNKANPSSCNSLYDDVENPELRAIVEKVAATTPYREETSTNEAQSPPNPQKRISGKQRKATLEEYQQLHYNSKTLKSHTCIYVLIFKFFISTMSVTIKLFVYLHPQGSDESSWSGNALRRHT